VNVVLLTTETPHHLYYGWKLSERVPLAAIVLETKTPSPPFETFHPFEARRDAYEREELLAGFNGSFSQLAATDSVESANDAEAFLASLAPDVVLAFGIGRLLGSIILLPTTACLNLHGGNPEDYRGLDTHLWTVYHRDFSNLVTTLHHVDEGLDTGDIVGQTQLSVARGAGLHQLRAVNTRASVELSLAALETIESGRALPARRQGRIGRYYSFMPSVLKEVSVSNFERWTAEL
jgi:methionyl-tRNA formyltransferase